MPKQRSRAIRLGVLVTLGLLLLVVTIYILGSKQNLFTQVIHVKAAFKDIRGLVVGNNVRYKGLNVGNVSEIEIVSDSIIIVDLAIKKQYSKFIYRNSQVEIGQEGLMGSKLVFLTTGSPDAGLLRDEDILVAKEGIDIENMLYEAREILLETKGLAVNLKNISNKIDAGEGDLGALLNDKTLTPKLNATADQLNAIATTTRQITNKINNGNGDLARLLNEQTITNQTEEILANLNRTSLRADSAVYQLNKTTRTINEGEGIVTRILYDKALAQKVDTTVTGVDEGVKQIISTAKAIEDSWLIRLFSKKKKTQPSPARNVPDAELQPEVKIVVPPDTVTVR